MEEARGEGQKGRWGGGERGGVRTTSARSGKHLARELNRLERRTDNLDVMRCDRQKDNYFFLSPSPPSFLSRSQGAHTCVTLTRT